MSFENDKIYNFLGGSNTISKKKLVFGGSRFDKFSKFQKVKIICFKDVPIYFLICFEVFWYKDSHKYGVHGAKNDQE